MILFRTISTFQYLCLPCPCIITPAFHINVTEQRACTCMICTCSNMCMRVCVRVCASLYENRFVCVSLHSEIVDPLYVYMCHTRDDNKVCYIPNICEVPSLYIRRLYAVTFAIVCFSFIPPVSPLFFFVCSQYSELIII